LWHIIDSRYCFLEYKQINWDSVYGVYVSRVDTVSSEYALFDVMADMLAELKDGHVNLYSDFDRSRYMKFYTDYPANFNDSLIHADRYLSLFYRSVNGLQYRKIEQGKVGYLYYSSFAYTFTHQNSKYLFDQFKTCKGLIIDVRNNGGGSLSMSERLASYFMDKRTLTGYICHKTGSGHSDFSDLTPIYTPSNDSIHWAKPVVVLTNRQSYSATNSFVCRMKKASQAVIIGDRTGGLPNGWMIRFSACPMFDADKQSIEWGIDPDIKVDLLPEDLEKGYDTLIEEAIRWILEEPHHSSE